MIQLVISKRGEVLGRGVFSQPTVTIGRSPENDVVVDDPAFSCFHALIESSGGRWVLRDRGSTNGVFHCGLRVAEWALNDGDEVAVGPYQLTFALDEPEEEAPGLEALGATPADARRRAQLGATLHHQGRRVDADQRERSANLRAWLLDAGEGRWWACERDLLSIGHAAWADLVLPGRGERVCAALARGWSGFVLVNMCGDPRRVLVQGEPVARRAWLRREARLLIDGRELLFSLVAPRDTSAVVHQARGAGRPTP